MSAAVYVTLRVGATAAGPGAGAHPHTGAQRGGLLPVTGAAITSLVAVALGLLVLGTIVLLHLRREPA